MSDDLSSRIHLRCDRSESGARTPREAIYLADVTIKLCAINSPKLLDKEMVTSLKIFGSCFVENYEF